MRRRFSCKSRLILSSESTRCFHVPLSKRHPNGELIYEEIDQPRR
jgi:hypothetical protein